VLESETANSAPAVAESKATPPKQNMSQVKRRGGVAAVFANPGLLGMLSGLRVDWAGIWEGTEGGLVFFTSYFITRKLETIVGDIVKNGKKILEDYLGKLTIVSNFFLNLLVIEALSKIGFGTTTEILVGNLRLRFSRI
jgi:hypothetical protein